MAQSAIEKLMSAVNKTKSAGFTDPHEGKFWRAEQDSAGNAFCVIRFLPGRSEDDVPFVKTYSHGFQGPGGRWYIEPCPTTIDEKCPVCDGNSELVASGGGWKEIPEGSELKKTIRNRNRKVAYLSNILVVSDPKHPENEGKVFIFKYGQKIFDKVVGALTPEFEDEKPMNPFDLVEGCNFKLKIRKVENYANYDKSEFDKSSDITDDVDLSTLHDINTFVTAAEFKTYDALKTKYDMIVGTVAKVSHDDNDDDDSDAAAIAAAVKAAKAPKKEAKKPAAKVEEAASEDDDLAYFQSLADD